MNQIRTLATSVIILFAFGCTEVEVDEGYVSYNECYLKEVQKCTVECRASAQKYCTNFLGKHYSKEIREQGKPCDYVLSLGEQNPDYSSEDVYRCWLHEGQVK